MPAADGSKFPLIAGNDQLRPVSSGGTTGPNSALPGASSRRPVTSTEPTYDGRDTHATLLANTPAGKRVGNGTISADAPETIAKTGPRPKAVPSMPLKHGSAVVGATPAVTGHEKPAPEPGPDAAFCDPSQDTATIRRATATAHLVRIRQLYTALAGIGSTSPCAPGLVAPPSAGRRFQESLVPARRTRKPRSLL